MPEPSSYKPILPRRQYLPNLLCLMLEPVVMRNHRDIGLFMSNLFGEVLLELEGLGLTEPFDRG